MIKNEKSKKESKKIMLGKIVIANSITELIISSIVIIFAILYFMSPDIFFIKTARFGKGSEIDNNNVITALGTENTEEKFNLYFQWFNVLHELGHGILGYNSDIKLSNVEEEQVVNDFALAYWLYYGEEEKINELNDIVDYAVNNIKSDAEEGITHMEFAEKNWYKSSFKTFNNYGWFQYSCVKESLNKRKTLDVVLKEMGIENVKLPEPRLLKYGKINEKISNQIINDAVNNFNEWGLTFPKAYQSFGDDPYVNYSKKAKNIFGIYDFIYSKY